jgi:hypothetical protein
MVRKGNSSQIARKIETAEFGPILVHSFAEPVTLSSTDPTDFPLPGTAARIRFDLLASRTRRTRESREALNGMQEGSSAFFPQFADEASAPARNSSQIA